MTYVDFKHYSKTLLFFINLCDYYQESTSSKKAKTNDEEEEAEGSDKSKSEVEDEVEQDGNEIYKTFITASMTDGFAYFFPDIWYNLMIAG
jgi:hypothetical protein